MATTNSLMDLLKDFLDLGRVDASEVWKGVPSLVEYYIHDIIPRYSKFYTSGLGLLDPEASYSEVR